VPGTTNPVTNYNKNYSNRIAENVKAPNKKIAKTEHSERGSKENKQAINRMSLNRSNIASTTEVLRNCSQENLFLRRRIWLLLRCSCTRVPSHSRRVLTQKAFRKGESSKSTKKSICCKERLKLRPSKTPSKKQKMC
jgi:hypothetical protein